MVEGENLGRNERLPLDMKERILPPADAEPSCELHRLTVDGTKVLPICGIQPGLEARAISCNEKTR